MTMTEEEIIEEKPLPIIPMPKDDLVIVLLLGGAVGLLVWGLGLLLDRYVFDSILCQGEISQQCGNAKNYAAAVASVFGAIAALIGLVRFRMYRPLLVVIASLLSTWGIVQISWNLNWVTGLLVVFVLYALAFGLYGWISRVREFWIALVVMTILVVAVRLALTV